jgi:hypothetical protein
MGAHGVDIHHLEGALYYSVASSGKQRALLIDLK